MGITKDSVKELLDKCFKSGKDNTIVHVNNSRFVFSSDEFVYKGHRLTNTSNF